MREMGWKWPGSSPPGPSGWISFPLAYTATGGRSLFPEIEADCDTGNWISSQMGPWLGASFTWALNQTKGLWWPVGWSDGCGAFPSLGGGPGGRSSSGTSAIASVALRTSHVVSSKSGLAAAWLLVIPTRQFLSRMSGEPRAVA